MSQTFWETEGVDDQQTAFDPQPEAQLEAQPEHTPVTVSADDFSALEERIVRAVELVKRERQLRAVAEERAAKAEAQLGEQSPQVDQLKQEIRALRAERDQVRQRVERLLSQLDALEL
jgi:septal ring factor EnvC (AmiA/AmiB activator)